MRRKQSKSLLSAAGTLWETPSIPTSPTAAPPPHLFWREVSGMPRFCRRRASAPYPSTKLPHTLQVGETDGGGARSVGRRGRCSVGGALQQSTEAGGVPTRGSCSSSGLRWLERRSEHCMPHRPPEYVSHPAAPTCAKRRCRGARRAEQRKGPPVWLPTHNRQHGLQVQIKYSTATGQHRQ